MKLYWRYKKDGKWTWKPVVSGQLGPDGAELTMMRGEEE